MRELVLALALEVERRHLTHSNRNLTVTFQTLPNAPAHISFTNTSHLLVFSELWALVCHMLFSDSLLPKRVRVLLT